MPSVRFIDAAAPARKKRDEPEHRLSHAVSRLLSRILEEPCWFTAQDHSGRAIGDTKEARARSQIRWNEARKKQGIKPDQLDWRVIQAPLYAEFELKYRSVTPSEGQGVTMRLLSERGIPNACCGELADVVRFLERSGFRLHGNTANILIEETARYEAADALARAGIDKPKRTSKPFTPKPSQSRVKKMLAVQGRVRF
jgi:hypothetical protein